jgi:hypothetical protein
MTNAPHRRFARLPDLTRMRGMTMMAAVVIRNLTL